MNSFYRKRNLTHESDVLKLFSTAITYRDLHKVEAEKFAMFVFDSTSGAQSYKNLIDAEACGIRDLGSRTGRDASQG